MQPCLASLLLLLKKFHQGLKEEQNGRILRSTSKNFLLMLQRYTEQLLGRFGLGCLAGNLFCAYIFGDSLKKSYRCINTSSSDSFEHQHGARIDQVSIIGQEDQ